MRKLNTPGLPHASGTARTHYNQWCCLHQMRDTTRQIPHSKLPHPIYDVAYWHKVKMSCGQTQPGMLRRGVWFRSSSLIFHQASGCVNSSSAAHALCGGIAPYVATFLVNIIHLPRSYSYLTNLEKSSPIHTWSSGRLRWRELEDTCTNADEWHEWRWFQISEFCIWFPNKVHRSSQNKYAE